MRRSAITFVAVAGALIAGPILANAMGDAPPSPAPKPKQKPKVECKKGFVYSATKKRCVKEKSNSVPDRALLDKGWTLAYAGKYQLAMDTFRLVADEKSPSALNGLGYTHRKLGQLERGIDYYKQALAIDPDYLLAREYLGEGYVMSGQIDLARAQLSQIRQRCGTSCKEYRFLARAISTGSENDW